MNDSLLQMNTFFPNELMAIESIEQDNCNAHIKTDNCGRIHSERNIQPPTLYVPHYILIIYCF